MTIGNVVVPVQFTMVLLEQCSGATITVPAGNKFYTDSPFAYALGANAYSIVYDETTLVSTTATTDCGALNIQFLTSNGFAYDGDVFSEDRATNGQWEFIVGQVSGASYA